MIEIMNNKKLNKAFLDILHVLQELNKLPKLKYPELTSDVNDLLWLIDGVNECKERILTERDEKSISYYSKKISEKQKEINLKHIHLLN